MEPPSRLCSEYWSRWKSIPVAVWMALATASRRPLPIETTSRVAPFISRVTDAVMPLFWMKWASLTLKGFSLFRYCCSKMRQTSAADSSLWLWSDTALTL